MSTERDRAPLEENVWIARILRTGLVVSCLLLFAALVSAFAEGRIDAARLGPHDLAGADPPTASAALGVVVLACTPAVRVLGLAILWARERDWRFVGVALVVVAVLVAATVLGHA